MDKETVYQVRFNEREFPSVLDMLRYERGVITDWMRGPGTGYFTITIASRSCVVDRWRSFGITPNLTSRIV